MEETPKPLLNKKIIMAVAGLVLVLLVLIMVSTLVKRTKSSGQTGKGPLSEPNKLVATVGGKKIYSSDIQKNVQEQYGRADVTKEQEQDIIDQVVEREILDQAAKDLGITLSQSTIQQTAKYKFPKENGLVLNQNELDAAKYSLLRNEVTAREVASRIAFVIDYWTPPYDYSPNFTDEQKVLFDKRRQEGKKALDEIETRMKKEEPPLNIARSIITNPSYADIKAILALNGYIVNDNSDLSVFLNPKAYVYQPDDDSKLFYDTLFSMKENTIQTLYEDEGPGSGGRVIHLIRISEGKFKTYEDWLTNKKKTLMK